MKKLFVLVAIIVVLFGLLYVINMQSNQVGADNPYGVSASKLHPATRDQLDDPNYQNIILPEQLDAKIQNNESVFVYYFQPTCPHCKVTTPVVNPIAQEAGVDLKQLNLLEYQEGWSKYKIAGTPTIVFYKDGKEAGRIENGVNEPGTTVGNDPEDFKKFFETHKP